MSGGTDPSFRAAEECIDETALNRQWTYDLEEARDPEGKATPSCFPAAGEKGMCLYDEQCVAAGGNALGGYCPGPNDVKCCMSL